MSTKWLVIETYFEENKCFATITAVWRVKKMDAPSCLFIAIADKDALKSSEMCRSLKVEAKS